MAAVRALSAFKPITWVRAGYDNQLVHQLLDCCKFLAHDAESGAELDV